MARQPESGQMLKDGFEKLGNPKWSMPITDKIKLRNWDEPDVEDDDGLAAGHLKQAQKIMPTNLESSGSWKWLGLAAMVAFVCADYIKDKRFVITGSKF